MATIRKSIESARGCGYRKKGGIYLVSGSGSMGCGKLPIPLTVCPCCGAGIKFTRGFTWITADLFADTLCSYKTDPVLDPAQCIVCPAKFAPGTKLGLLWIGEKFYKSTIDFSNEARSRGISRRIAAVPRNFKVGETWIALAHIKAMPPLIDGGFNYPGIFQFFRPTAIEYIVTGSETEDELNDLEKRGFTLVNVIPDTEIQLPLIE